MDQSSRLAAPRALEGRPQDEVAQAPERGGASCRGLGRPTRSKSSGRNAAGADRPDEHAFGVSTSSCRKSVSSSGNLSVKSRRGRVGMAELSGPRGSHPSVRSATTTTLEEPIDRRRCGVEPDGACPRLLDRNQSMMGDPTRSLIRAPVSRRRPRSAWLRLWRAFASRD
jgi:hypothetical protein